MKNLIVLIILVCLYGCSPVELAGTTDETELSIKGSVSNDNGTPAAEVDVLLFTKNSTVPFVTTKTNVNGLFKFEKITSGTYSLWVEDNDSIAVASRTFSHSPDDTVSYNLILIRGGTLTAYVRLSDGGSPKNVVVSVPGTPRVLNADSLGIINIYNLAQGDFSLFLMAGSNGNNSVTRPFTITGSKGDTLKDTIIITPINPKPSQYGIWDITTGNGITIAVGSNGTVLSSPDGVNWTNRITDQVVLKGGDFQGIAWGNNRFVVLDKRGFVFHSSDGITWLDSNQYQITSQDGKIPYRISYVNDQFILYDIFSEDQSDSNVIWTSKDAVAWTSHKISCQPKQIVGNGTQLIATTFKGIFTSSDALNWTKMNSMFVNHLVYEKAGIFIGTHPIPVVGNEYFTKTQIVSSRDGNQWEILCDSLCIGDRYLLWGNNRFNFFNTFEIYNMELLTSVDGKTWVNEGHLDTPFSSDYKIEWNGERFICIGGKGLIATSEDGIHWNENAMIGDFFSTLVWNGTDFVGVRTGLSMFSATGSKWTKKINECHYGTPQTLSWGNGKYITETGPYAYISPDALTWTEVIIDSNHATLEHFERDSSTLYKVVAGKDRFVAYAYPNHFYMSLDGLTWKRTDVPIEINNRHCKGQGLLFYGDSQFVAVDYYGSIYLSEDGINWTVKDVGLVAGQDKSFASASPATLLIVSSYGKAFISHNNGKTWISSPCPEINALSSLLWDGDQFVATTDDAFWTSSDGISWRRRGDIPEAAEDYFSGYDHIVLSSAFNGTNYVILTHTGSIYTINKFTK